MMTQSQTTYHLKWQTPRFGVVARGVDGAWPYDFYFDRGDGKATGGGKGGDKSGGKGGGEQARQPAADKA